MITITNLISESVPRRELFESAVRDAFVDTQWSCEITLTDGHETVVVEMRKGAATVYAFFKQGAGPREITERLKDCRP